MKVLWVVMVCVAISSNLVWCSNSAKSWRLSTDDTVVVVAEVNGTAVLTQLGAAKDNSNWLPAPVPELLLPSVTQGGSPLPTNWQYQGGDLDLGGGERRPAGSGAGRAAAPNAPPDAVRAQPTLGPPGVPPSPHALVPASGFVQGGPRVLFVAALSQHDGQVLQCGGQFHGRPERAVVRHGFPERVGIGLKEPVTSQAGRGRPGRVGLRRGLRRTGPRCGLRHRPVARGQREPDQIRQPLVDQRHLPVAPRQHRG